MTQRLLYVAAAVVAVVAAVLLAWTWWALHGSSAGVSEAQAVARSETVLWPNIDLPTATPPAVPGGEVRLEEVDRPSGGQVTDSEGAVRDGGVERGAGSTVALLTVPAAGIDALPVRAGVGSDVLNSGVAGWYPDTRLPHDGGLMAVAAHRQGYGEPFRHLDAVTTGDEVVVRTAAGVARYRVTGTTVIKDTDSSVLEPGVADLVLTTCLLLGAPDDERLVVFADRV